MSDWMGLLGDFGSSALEFAKANPALTGAALGAGAGYLANGGQGALLGGALGGGLGYGAGQGLLGEGMQDYLAGADQSYGVGSLLGFGGNKPNADQLAYNKEYMKVVDATPAEEKMLEQGYRNLATPQQGLLGNAQNFYKQNEGLFDFGKDAFKTYGDYTKNQSTADMNQAQMDYIRNLQREQTAENLYKRNTRNQMQSNLNAGYAGSSLSNYYTP